MKNPFELLCVLNILKVIIKIYFIDAEIENGYRQWACIKCRKQVVRCLSCCIIKNLELDILQEIPDEGLPKLRDLFRNKLPFGLHAYYWIDNYIKWKKQLITNIKFFCLEQNWDDGTFISVEECQTSLQIFVFTLDKTGKKLRKLLQITEKIDWKNPNLIFLAVHDEFKTIIQEEIKRRHIKGEKYNVSFLWWLPRLLALSYKFDLPEDLCLAPLNERDADVISTHWKQDAYREPLSVEDIRRIIISNGGFGLYTKVDGQLCSWIAQDNYGSLSILQTADKFRGFGYATILVKHFCKHWSFRGNDTFCFTMVDNTQAYRLFRKLGFRKTHEVVWINIKNK